MNDPRVANKVGIQINFDFHGDFGNYGPKRKKKHWPQLVFGKSMETVLFSQISI